MLSREDNELITRVGPGTPMGELMRRFWLPALLESEVPTPDCDPVRLRLMGEDLVVFRDSEGRIGALDAYCPHRRAHLYFGRNEECGLRCVYHGWKFDVDGNCVDMPSEPADSGFKDKVRQTAYPAVARGGMVWVYMGPAELTPERPDFEWTRLPPEQRIMTKRHQLSNWLQGLEGGLDSSHISFLHRRFGPGEGVVAPYSQTRNPVFETEDEDYGVLIGARRIGPDGRYYWRVTPFLLPFYQMTPPIIRDDEDSRGYPYSFHMWVPIDDFHCWHMRVTTHPFRAFTEKERADDSWTWGPIDERFNPLCNVTNEYGLDRAKQRSESFAGIPGIQTQDSAMVESMGSIVDRTKEHLGTSDRGIIAARRRLLGLVKALQAGEEPIQPANGALYNIRSASVILPPETPWLEGSAWLMNPDRPQIAAE